MKWEGVNVRTRGKVEGIFSVAEWPGGELKASRGFDLFIDSEQGQLRERKICVPIFTRAPHQTGMHSLQQTMNPHFFFPCLHHGFHMWCRALKAPATPAVKYTIIE